MTALGWFAPLRDAMRSPRLIRAARHAVLAAGVGLTALMAGCASVEPSVYAGETPALDMRRYFDGRLVGHGMLLERNGKVSRRFVVEIRASWRDDVGTLEEDFVWSDGERQQRVWTLRPVPGEPNRWRGTAADVRGEAEGTAAGNSLHWRYTLQVTTREGRQYDIAFDDWMHLVDERVLLNRAVMRFYGLRVGELQVAFRKL
jgi:hypothetical protein